MRSDWVDPDDIRPNAARAARRIAGWRSFCPLRRMSGHPSSGITAEHIMAADKLRELFDVALLGYSADRPLIFVQQSTLPRWGLNPAALAQTKAMRALARVVLVFSRPEMALIQAIILRNQTLRQWAQQTSGSPLVEKTKLLAVLTKLVAHFDSEIADEVARGRRLLP